jgi:hypothetical protein
VEAGKSIESARLVITADNSFEVWVNGRLAGAGGDFNQAFVLEIATLLKPGANMLAVAADNGAETPNPAGLIGSLAIRFSDGTQLKGYEREHLENAWTRYL